jgi:hypothetical protein
MSRSTIAGRYRSAVETGDRAALVRLYHPDALLDAHVPNWRFQLQGRDAVAEYTGGALPGPGRFSDFHAEATASGDVIVLFTWRHRGDQGDPVVRQLHVLRLDAGRIAEQTLFCAGIWGPKLQERMSAEAPLIRP